MEYTIYGSKSCVNCVKAQLLLEDEGIGFTYIDIKDLGYSTVKEFIDAFAEQGKIPSTHRTIPVIFIDNAFIGGFTELSNRFKIRITDSES